MTASEHERANKILVHKLVQFRNTHGREPLSIEYSEIERDAMEEAISRSYLPAPLACMAAVLIIFFLSHC